MFKKSIAVVAWLLITWQSPAFAEGKVAIASANPLATAAGFEILAKGGNVFDAAVAVSAALTVVEPSGASLGGGGYWLLHRSGDGFETMIDAREKAPLAAHKDMFLDKAGKLDPKKPLDGALAAAIPGLPAGLVHLSEKYGRLSLQETLAPAIQLAKNGYAIGEIHRKLLKFRAELLKEDPKTAGIFLVSGEIPEPYSILKQPDLANTLQKIATSGRDGFYDGEVAEALVTAVKNAGGIWSQKDLDAYQIIEREPVRGEYHGIKITSAGPSSAGGITLIEALNVLSAYPLQSLDSATRKHLVTAALQRAYHDRVLYLGDPEFIDVPVQRLISQDYAAGLRSSIRLDKALPSSFLAGDVSEQSVGTHTTHFSIIDELGNRVASTLSINFPFGAGLVAGDTGVLLNDQMDDFASLAGAANGYGLVGGIANTIAPGKRMLSNMTPTFVEDGQRVAVLGTPGGSRIMSMVLLAVLDFAEGRGPESWVNLPRYHHQFMPDVLEYEDGAISPDEIAKLSAIGYKLKQARYRYGDMQGVQLQKNTHVLTAVSDRRGEGGAVVGQ
ncbi:MAG: gamma-glutamyltransferase [Methylococcales bacterium]|nr:gamma-glutamyltransferase [Methylococcaceae bacterium]